MVIAGKDRDSGPRILPKAAKGALSAAKSHPSARGRSSIPGAEARINGKESDAADASDKRKAARRKSRRLQNAKLRRSSRLLKRKQRTNIFDGLSFSSVQADLKAVSNIKKKQRLALSNISRRAIFSQSQKKQPPLLHRNLTEIQEENGEQTPENENDQDSDCGQSIDAKTSRASSLYNETRANDFLKNSLRISALGPNTTLHGGFRPRSSPWLRKADSDDDSDDSNSSLPPKYRPLNQNRLHRGAGLADIDPMAIDQTVCLL